MTSVVEHNSIRRPLGEQQTRFGVEVTAVDVDEQGRVNAVTYIDKKTASPVKLSATCCTSYVRLTSYDGLARTKPCAAIIVDKLTKA